MNKTKTNVGTCYTIIREIYKQKCNKNAEKAHVHGNKYNIAN